MAYDRSNHEIELRRNWAARLFLGGPFAFISSGGLVVRPRRTGPSVLLPYDSIVSATATRGWLWDTVTIRQATETVPVVLKGVRHCQASIIEAPARVAKTAAPLPLFGQLKRIVKHEVFVSAYDDQRLRACEAKASGDVQALSARIRGGVVEDAAWEAGLPALAFEESFEAYALRPRGEWNEKFVAAEIVRIRPWVNKRFQPPLTDDQLSAVVNDEDNQLVVAGAGTGKTTTVLAKIAYLVEVRGVQPEKILALAFNKDAAAEIRRRAEAFGIPCSANPDEKGVVAATYHSLGGNLVRDVERAVPKKVSALDADAFARDTFIRQTLLKLFRAKKTHEDVRDYLAFYSTPIEDARDYPSYESYVQSEAASNLRTLRDGCLVKSHGERIIANWLYLHGLEYEYEKQFAFAGGNPQSQRYQPDYTVKLPGRPALSGGPAQPGRPEQPGRQEFYIEYYGLDAKEQTAPGIDREGYLRSRDWKRGVHKQQKTTCIELTYAQLKSGAFFTALAAEIRKVIGVPLEAIPIAEVEKLFVAKKDEHASSEMDAAVDLLIRFLTLFRSNLWTVADIETRMMEPREQAFFRVFKPVLREYMKALDGANETDFAGLIADAVPLCQRWSRSFEHVIVDEFQDISRGREMFLREILKLAPGRRLCAVGDDWQSIYRFTGSDVTVMTGFKYGATARTDLKRSFRFNEALLKASSLFIQKNPAQLKKQLSANRPGTHRAIYLLEYDDTDGPDASLRAHRAAVKDYSKRFSPAKPDILFLSRYRRGVEAIERDLLPELKEPVTARNLTVHRSKGLEADCVILSEARGGRMGFPCAREDDPMIRRVLTDPDDFPHAEERRLFYVALTRAKTCVYIVAPVGTRSIFISELLEDFTGDPTTQLMVDLSTADAKKVHRCPVCRGHLVSRVANGETFWSCENSPACYFTTQECSGCRKSPLLPHREKAGRLHCAACGESTVDACPRCKVGSLVRRVRRVDSKPFWACSFFAKTGCSYTANQLAS